MSYLDSKPSNSPVKGATSGNVALAGGIVNGTSHNGVTYVTGDLVLYKDQTIASENGVYVVPASGTATRASMLATGVDASGATVFVKSGGAQGTTYQQIFSPAAVGTDLLSFASLSQATVPEYGYLSVPSTSNLSKTNGYSAAPGTSFTLPTAGVWKVTYELTPGTWGGGLGQNWLFRLFNVTANAAVADSAVAVHMPNDASGTTQPITASRTVLVTTNGSTSFNVQVNHQATDNFYVLGAGGVADRITWQKVSGGSITGGQSVDSFMAKQLNANSPYNAFPTNNSPFTFDTIVDNTGLAHTISSSGQVTLRANKKYYLRASMIGTGMGSSIGSSITYAWYNHTTNALMGNTGRIHSILAPNGESGGGDAIHVFTPSVDTVVSLRVLSGGGSTGTWGAYSANADYGTYPTSVIEIRQIGSTAIVAQTAQSTTTSGTAITIPNQSVRNYINPPAVMPSLTITLPAAPIDGDVVKLLFGGTVTANNPVVTTLSVVANAGHTLYGGFSLTSAKGGEMAQYVFNSTTNSWFREL
jgi:hypothetical protein